MPGGTNARIRFVGAEHDKGGVLSNWGEGYRTKKRGAKEEMKDISPTTPLILKLFTSRKLG
ncbi:hypothetical protein J15TS10_36180 [Paenibacillus woosongensis]|uniref:Uncharacterized protein n=1 Tax=Paenibacillus woosongensis TaxID=307580 RepID=A0ABQ4MV51_9BACL|nr:hypothetical protein J15TS10_36180 [Paenibacillus woosongensis]